MTQRVVGLLPLYVALYDEAVPELRPHVEAHCEDVRTALEGAGLTVVAAPICRVAAEFEQAVADFEQAGVDAILTVHLAYSPSLEAENALSRTELPLIMLDTTPSETFDEDTDPGELMFNHGIHGVQDLCNRLVRRGKRFDIHAGHLTGSDVLARVRHSVEAAAIVRALRSARVGLVGEVFDGMGDFRVDFDDLRTDLGPTVVRADAGLPMASEIPQSDVESELAGDRERFDADPEAWEAHRDSVRAGLALRSWVAENELTALTVNFLAAAPSHPMLPVMPFVECSTLMARGIGYAGEGDVLTAALVSALMRVFPDTTFTEMFCPDWRGDAVFLSHMGEVNYRVTEGRPVLRRLPFPYTDAADPSVAYATLRGGRATMVNLAPFGAGRYRLTLAPGEMRVVRKPNRLASLMNGWFRPERGLVPFLEEFSRGGGTHHSALVYAEPEQVASVLTSVASFLDLELVSIRAGR